MTRKRSTKGKPTANHGPTANDEPAANHGPAAEHDPTAERASVDRMTADHERAPLRLLAGNPVHERGVRLGCASWSAIVSLPIVCETVGEDCPGWAWELCQHAAAVCQGSPPALLEALLVADRDGAGAPCDPKVATLGAQLDLCVASPHVGRGAWISITPFGHAVALLHRLHLDVLAAVAEHGGG